MSDGYRNAKNLRGFGGTMLLPLIAVLLSATSAVAQNWTEAGDAGSLVASAQVTAGSGPLQSISGSLAEHGDVDVYCLQLNAAPPAGLVLAAFNCASQAYPSMYLFDANGMGVIANMLCWGGSKYLVAPNGSLAPGLYYLAISHPGYLPQSAGGPIWNYTQGGQTPPDGSGGGFPLVSWVGPDSVVPVWEYVITTQGNYITFCETATSVETSTWGALKAVYGN